MKPLFLYSRRSCRKFVCKRRRALSAKVLSKALSARLSFSQTRSMAHALLCPTLANSRIFDKVQDMLWAEADEAAGCARTEAVAELRATYAAALETEEVWATVRSDDIFIQTVACMLGDIAAH